MNELSNAKVGDKVIICGHFGDEEVGVIEKITLKGYLKVGGCLYYTNGSKRSTSGYTNHIKLVTDEEIEKIEKRSFCSKGLNKLHALKDISYERAVLKDTNVHRSIILPKEISEKINEFAKENYTTFNAIVKKILVEYFKNN